MSLPPVRTASGWALVALSLIYFLPFITTGGGSGAPTTVGLPIIFGSSSHPGSTPHNGAVSATTGLFTVTGNQTLVVTIAAVACKTVCGTTVPSIVSVIDGFHLSLTQKLAIKSNIEDFEIYTLQLPSTITGGLDGVQVTWNQTTVGQIEAAAYSNVKSVGATQTGSGTGSTASLTITTTTSGSWIVGGTGFANNTITVPNASGLIGRNQTPNSPACFTNPPPYPCVSTDIEDTNGTQYVNGYQFLYSSRTSNGLSFRFLQGAIELTPGLTEPTDQSNECTSTNNRCGPIAVDTIVSGNSSVSPTLSGSWTATQGEMIVVTASTGNVFFPSKVSTVTDTLGSFFVQQIVELQLTGDLEVWSGLAPLTGKDSVSVTWNQTGLGPFAVQVVAYFGVANIGAKAGASGITGTSASVTITTTQSGSWYFGAVSKAAILSCSLIVTPASFIRRSNFCNQSNGLPLFETEVDDNGTATQNGLSLAYSPSWGTDNQAFEIVELELLASDREPNTVLNIPSTFCQNTADTCHINWANKASGINTLQTLALGTEYCTGITTAALSITTAQPISSFATYTAVDTNQTGAVLLIKVFISTTVPTTTFGAGACAGGATLMATGKISFTVTGANSQFSAQYFSQSVDGYFSSSGGTFYVFIDIIPQNFTGHMSMAQWGAAPNSVLWQMELK